MRLKDIINLSLPLGGRKVVVVVSGLKLKSHVSTKYRYISTVDCLKISFTFMQNRLLAFEIFNPKVNVHAKGMD
jgi:hypothetical protein